MRHKIVHSCFRLAPHLRRHIWKGGLINKSNHHNQWPQSLQSSLASTLLLATTPQPDTGGGGSRLVRGRVHIGARPYKRSNMNSYLVSLGWISVKGRQGVWVCVCVCVCVCLGWSRLRKRLGGRSLWPRWPGTVTVSQARRLWQGSTARLLSPGISLHLFTTDCCCFTFPLHQVELLPFTPASHCW